MDNYLENFTEQLDEAFTPETLFRDNELSILGWLHRKFFGRKNEKQQEDIPQQHMIRLKLNLFNKKIPQNIILK